jgi:hypothetical protein
VVRQSPVLQSLRDWKLQRHRTEQTSRILPQTARNLKISRNNGKINDLHKLFGKVQESSIKPRMDANRREYSEIRSMGSAVVLVASRHSGDGPTAVLGVSPNTSLSGFFFSWGAGRNTRPTTTGTVALPKIREDLRPFAVAISFHRNPLPLDVIRKSFNAHARNLTISAQNRKTYGRFLGVIFLDGLHRREFLPCNSLQPNKSHKLAKPQNKMSFSFAQMPLFLPKRPKRGPISTPFRSNLVGFRSTRLSPNYFFIRG